MRHGRPNILFLHGDQLNTFALGATGCREVSTPNMDRLLERGAWFRHSCVTNPLCCPSRTSWYTGLISEESGAFWSDRPLNPSVADIGPAISGAGYDSIYMGKWHVGRRVQDSFTLEFNGHCDGEVGDAYTARAAEAFLANRQRETPFFLNVGLLNPHDCCQWEFVFTPCGPGKYGMARKLADRLPELPPNHHLSAYPTAVTISGAAADPTRGHWTELDWRYYMYCYYRSVEMLDVEVGRIVGALENSRFADNTILIFASDHGEGLAQHYHYGKNCVLDHSVMAPLVVLDPSAGHRRDLTHMVSNIDLTATICDYAGVEPLAGRRGLSLRPLVEGRACPWRPYAASTTSFLRERMIRTPDYKLINDRVNGQYVFYDLAKDPWEMRNAIEDPAYIRPIAQLKTYMDEHEAGCRFDPQAVRMLESWEEEKRKNGRNSTAGFCWV